MAKEEHGFDLPEDKAARVQRPSSTSMVHRAAFVMPYLVPI
jgi:hypothetical protein